MSTNSGNGNRAGSASSLQPPVTSINVAKIARARLSHLASRIGAGNLPERATVLNVCFARTSDEYHAAHICQSGDEHQ
jgi:hypothetical protein